MNPNHATSQTVGEILGGWMREAFATAFLGDGCDVSNITVVAAANPEFGDYQCNAAMGLAKPLRQAPRAIAQAAVDQAPPHPAVDRIEIAGPGFINLYINDLWLIDRLQTWVGADLVVPQVGAGRTVILDYSSPNVAKPMHIGHIRSTIIGNAIDRLHRCLGYRVVADNHIGDWGTQFGILIKGYRHFLDEKALETEPVEELERVYVRSYEQTKADENWLKECRAELVKLQSGDPENLALWHRFVGLSLAEFARIYQRLGVSFDLMHGESHYRDQLPGVIDTLVKGGLATQSDGATVVFLEEEKLPVCIVRKSDGGFNYATSDLATIASRVAEFNPEKIVYVTDERQQLHFRQVFTVARKLGVTVQLDHVWFGLMRLPSGTFSTREGNVIKLERLLDEAEERALKIVTEANPGMPEARRREVARVVGIGAVKYADLSQNPQTTITFTWDKALALDGNSGPYLQYAYARIASVHDKYAERFPAQDADTFPVCFTDPLERTLALKLVRFPDVIEKAAHAYKPSMVADYLYDLAQAYSSFYQNVPFLKAPEGTRESRVRLCGMVARVLRKGLELLGIGTLERI